MLRIGYFGDGAWAQKALLKIANNSAFSVAFIVLRYKTPDKELEALAQKLNIPCFCVPNVNAEDFMRRIQEFSPEINVSMSFDQILKSDIIHLAPKGFINCHAGALPFYRGRNILNWALINGEKQFGVTVHYVDEGIDTGDIILQRFSPILREDRYGDLLNKASNLCAETLYDALVQIHDGTAQAIPQNAIQGSIAVRAKTGMNLLIGRGARRGFISLCGGLPSPRRERGHFAGEGNISLTVWR